MASNQNVLQLTQQSTTDPTSVFYAVTGGTTDTGLPLSVLSSYLIKAYPGFLQTETGAVARSVQAKLQDIVSVIDFGADPTGGLDSTIAIQNAINSGDFVFVPEGTYKLTTSLNITSPVTISGAGKGLVTFTQSSNFTVFNLSGFSGGWSLENFQIKNTQTIGAVTSGDAIRVLNAANGTAKDINITGTFNGIHVTNSQNTYFDGVSVFNHANAGYIFDGANNDVFVQNCYIDGEQTGTPTATYGIYLNNSAQALTFSNIEVILCVTAMSMANTSFTVGNRPAYCKFISVYFDSCTNGPVIDNCVDMEFTNCWFSNRPNSGAIVGSTNADGVIFNACTFANNGQHGCLVQANAVRTKFIGCNFLGNSTTSASTYHGLTIAANVTDFSVVGCTATNSVYGFGTQGWGIIVLTGTSNRYNITDNLTNGNATGGVSDGGTGTNKLVFNPDTQTSVKFPNVTVTTLQATSTITPATTSGIVGTTLADNANAGSVGEVISSTVLVGAAVALTSATPANITSISLTAGDWDVWGEIVTNPAGTTVQSVTQGSISTTSATFPTFPNGGAGVILPFSNTGSAVATSVGLTRINVSTTTTVYLVGQSTFTTSTNAMYGFIGARRRR